MCNCVCYLVTCSINVLCICILSSLRREKKREGGKKKASTTFCLPTVGKPALCLRSCSLRFPVWILKVNFLARQRPRDLSRKASWTSGHPLRQASQNQTMANLSDQPQRQTPHRTGGKTKFNAAKEDSETNTWGDQSGLSIIRRSGNLSTLMSNKPLNKIVKIMSSSIFSFCERQSLYVWGGKMKNNINLYLKYEECGLRAMCWVTVGLCYHMLQTISTD